MLLKISIALVVIIAGFLAYVSTRDGHFRIERSQVIKAPASKIFPYISQLKLSHEWSPYEKKDPNMKKNFSGIDGQPGSKMVFEGNKDAGSGIMEILKIMPDEAVDLKLTMTAPFHAENTVFYLLTPETEGTRFTWAMEGDGGFMGKLMSTLMDIDKMVGADFEKGIDNLKQLVESK